MKGTCPEDQVFEMHKIETVNMTIYEKCNLLKKVKQKLKDFDCLRANGGAIAILVINWHYVTSYILALF